MTTTNEQQIISQREKVSQPNPKLNIIAPCKIGNGILKLTDSEWESYNNAFKNLNCKIGDVLCLVQNESLCVDLNLGADSSHQKSNLHLLI